MIIRAQFLFFILTLSCITILPASGIEKLEIKPGLYIRTSDDFYSKDLENINDLKYLLEERKNIFLTDGKFLRQGSGPSTERVPDNEQSRPFAELGFCKFDPSALCYNAKYTGTGHYYKLLGITEKGIQHTCYNLKTNEFNDCPNLYFIRIENPDIAAKYIEETEVLRTFPKKNLVDFGYVRTLKVIERGKIYRVKVSSLIIRTQPNKKSKAAGSIKMYEEAEVLKKTDVVEIIDDINAPWVKIKSSTGKEGYVFGGFLEEIK